MGLRGRRKSLTIGFISLFLIAVILAVRNLYSFSWSDESFYVAEIHRIFLGGKPFVDEWHPTQFYAILFVPIYYTYVKLRGGGREGIYLFIRNLYLLLDFLTAYYVFYIFRMKVKLKTQYCVAAGAFVLLYSWANVMGISYHNLFMLAMIIASMLLIKVMCDQEEMSRKKCIGYGVAVGIFSGVGIITIPTAIIMIGILFLILCYLCFIRKMHQDKISILIGSACGMVIDAILYMYIVLNRVSVADLLIHMGYLFRDEDHKAKNFTGYFLSLIYLLNEYGKYILILICIAICVQTILFIKKITGPQVRDVLFFVSVPVLMYSLYIYANSHMSTYIIFGLYGFFCMILFVERNWLEHGELMMIMSIVGITGFVMVGTFLFASATSGPMSSGFVCFSFITLMLMDKKQEYYKEKYKMAIGVVFAGMLAVMLGMTGIVRIVSVYRDAPLGQMNTRLEKGPGKGLLTTVEHANQYYACMDVIDALNEVEKDVSEKTIIVSKQAPWIYVGLNIQNGAPTAWTCEISNPNIEEYYRTHNIEQLKYILVLREEFGGYFGAGNPEGTCFTPNGNDISGWLGDLIEREYSARGVSCGILYVRKDK